MSGINNKGKRFKINGFSHYGREDVADRKQSR
jgi:hypothetical protein